MYISLSTYSLLKIIGGELFKHFLENIISADMSALNFTFHFPDHPSILAISLFKILLRFQKGPWHLQKEKYHQQK